MTPREGWIDVQAALGMGNDPHVFKHIEQKAEREAVRHGCRLIEYVGVVKITERGNEVHRWRMEEL